jgi:hypothetical protein
VTTVKTKRLLVKEVISIADAYPMAFQRLRLGGLVPLRAELEDFGREHPGHRRDELPARGLRGGHTPVPADLMRDL